MLAILATACTSSLSVEEYARWCAGLSAGVRAGVVGDFVFQSPGSTSETISRLDAIINEYQKVDPPEVLSQYHTTAIDLAEDLKFYFETLEQDSDTNPFGLLGALSLPAARHQAAENALPPDVRQSLEEAGCDSDQEDSDPTATPTATVTRLPSVT